MTLVSDDFSERNPRAGRVERVNDFAGFRSWEQPVAGKRDDAKPRSRALKCLGQHTIVVGGKIEIVHRACQVEVGICIKAFDERNPLVAQV